MSPSSSWTSIFNIVQKRSAFSDMLAKHPSESLNTTQFILNVLLASQTSEISLSLPPALGKRLCCGLGHHKAGYRFFELPVHLVRNNHHVWQHLIPI